jgi:hypothetical protein
MVRPRRPTLRKQWIQRPYARHASPIRTPAVAATHNAPLAPELPDRHRAREKREVDRRKVRQVAHRPARPRRSRTRRTSPLPKGLRNRAIIAPCCSAVRSAGPRWRRSPMGALRADSREATAASPGPPRPAHPPTSARRRCRWLPLPRLGSRGRDNLFVNHSPTEPRLAAVQRFGAPCLSTRRSVRHPVQRTSLCARPLARTPARRR